jgi:signal transduction histidine kinase
MSYPILPSIRACEKTFAIIPTALLENALKYSPEDTEIKIRFQEKPRGCTVCVSNLARSGNVLGPEVFNKGYRGNLQIEGSGNGLYVAQLVARQHGTQIQVSSRKVGTYSECSFCIDFGNLQ